MTLGEKLLCLLILTPYIAALIVLSWPISWWPFR